MLSRVWPQIWQIVIPLRSSLNLTMGYSRKILPSPQRMSVLRMQNFWNSTCCFTNRKSGFWVHVWIISGNPCENKDFCSKTQEIQDNISPLKGWKFNLLYGGNSTSSMGGGQNFSGIAQLHPMNSLFFSTNIEISQTFFISFTKK